MADHSFSTGWLTKDLEAAVNEVKNWSEGMRRGIAVDDINNYSAENKSRSVGLQSGTKQPSRK